MDETQKVIVDLFVTVVATLTFAVWGVTKWESRTFDAKTEACTLIHSQFVSENGRATHGYCLNGNVITYRFKG